MKKRLPYVDQLKGIAIFLVVFGHLIQNDTIESTTHPLFSWIYAFHMPLFMFISGYIAFKTVHIASAGEFLKFVQKKATVLLVPYFAWSLIVNEFFFTKETDFDFLGKAELLIKTGGGLWFLWYLFFILICYSLFYIPSVKFNKKNRIAVDVLLLGALFIFLVLIRPLHLLTSSNSFLMYLGFFFIGIFISKYPVLSNLLLNRWIFSLCFILFVLLSGKYEFGNESLVNLAIKISVAVLAIASLYYIIRNISWNPVVDKYVQSWGRGSLVIYATHFLIFRITSGEPILMNLSLVSLTVVLGLFSVIIIAACLFVQKIAGLCPPLNFILYGQKSRFRGDSPLYSASLKLQETHKQEKELVTNY